jgi:hypothetical protein
LQILVNGQIFPRETIGVRHQTMGLQSVFVGSISGGSGVGVEGGEGREQPCGGEDWEETGEKKQIVSSDVSGRLCGVHVGEEFCSGNGEWELYLWGAAAACVENRSREDC